MRLFLEGFGCRFKDNVVLGTVAYMAPELAARILDHLGIPSRPLPLARAQDPPQLSLYA